MAAHSDPMIEMYWCFRPCGNPELKYGGLTGAGEWSRDSTRQEPSSFWLSSRNRSPR